MSNASQYDEEAGRLSSRLLRQRVAFVRGRPAVGEQPTDGRCEQPPHHRTGRHDGDGERPGGADRELDEEPRPWDAARVHEAAGDGEEDGDQRAGEVREEGEQPDPALGVLDDRPPTCSPRIPTVWAL